MSDTDAVIRNLYIVREKHRARITQIDEALALLGQDTGLDELLEVGLPRFEGVREAVLAVLADRPGELIDIGQIYTAAVGRGWRTTSSNPRNSLASALARLAQAGEIEKGDRGQYRLPAEARELLSA